MFKAHPPGLKVLFFTEMWERFGFYLMLGIFALYMLDGTTGGLGFDKARTAEIYGTYIALLYLTPFFGGILADQLLGYGRCVIIGALLMASGYLCLGVPGILGAEAARLPLFYAGMGLVILGNGFLKPNISTMVGRLYPEGSTLRDSGFNIFYMGINIGAFACNFVAAILRNQWGWGYAFAAAGVGMLIGLVTFILGQRHVAEAARRTSDAPPNLSILGQLSYQIVLPAALTGTLGYLFLGGVFGSAPTAAFICAALPVVVYYVVLWLRAPAEERGPIGALLSICAVVVVFWMVFHQNGSSLTFWAEDNTRREAGVLTPVAQALYLDQDATIGTAIADPDAEGAYWRNVPAAERPASGERVSLISTEIFQSVNPFFVVVLTPLVVGLFGWLRTRGKEPSTPAKISLGMVVTALSTIPMIAAVVLTHAGATKASALWLVTTYGIITVGELFLSPMGLALVSKLAPKRVAALMMGGWFLATAIGNKLAGVMASFWETIPLVGIFAINCAAALAAALVIALLTPGIRRVMAEKR